MILLAEPDGERIWRSVKISCAGNTMFSCGDTPEAVARMMEQATNEPPVESQFSDELIAAATNMLREKNCYDRTDDLAEAADLIDKLYAAWIAADEDAHLQKEFLAVADARLDAIHRSWEPPAPVARVDSYLEQKP